jgi:hypothetical protein
LILDFPRYLAVKWGELAGFLTGKTVILSLKAVF